MNISCLLNVVCASAFTLIFSLSGSALAVEYTLIDLGTLGGTSINDSGQVTGESHTTDSRIHAFVWDAVNGMQDIGTLGGFDYSHGSGINNSGQITGDSFVGNDKHAFVWDAVNGMQDIGTLGGTYSEGNGINTNGQVTGYSDNTSGEYRAYVWDAINGMQDIGTLGTTSRGFAINDNGQVTGYSYPTTGGTHAFVWDAVNGMQDIGTLGGVFSSGKAINASGQVAGASTTATITSETRAFLWDPIDGIKDLGSFGGNSFGRGINSSGTVVGESFTNIPGGGTHAFVWDPINGMQNLCEITDCTSAGWTRLGYTSGINDKGDIVGTGITADGDRHAYVALVSPAITISIDIKPGKKYNAINPHSRGGIWVAVLSNNEFDPLQIDIPTVRFGPDKAEAIRHRVKDVDKDGLADLLLRFKMRKTGITCKDTEVTLTAKTFDGQVVDGSDSIKTVGCKHKKHHKKHPEYWKKHHYKCQKKH